MKPTAESVATLAQQWAAGDRLAGSELIRRHDDWIVAYARRKTLPWEDPDDTSQVMRLAFVQAARRVDQSFADGEVRDFLSKAMRRASATRRRDYRSPVQCAEWHDEMDEAARPCTADSRIELMDLICKSAMSDREADAIVALDGICMNETEASEALSTSPRSVGRLYNSALQKLRLVADVSLDGAREDGVQRRIRDFLTRNGPSLGPQIRCALGLPRTTFQRATRAMRAAGEIETIGENRGTLWGLVKREEAA